MVGFISSNHPIQRLDVSLQPAEFFFVEALLLLVVFALDLWILRVGSRVTALMHVPLSMRAHARILRHSPGVWASHAGVHLLLRAWNMLILNALENDCLDIVSQYRYRRLFQSCSPLVITK